MNWIINLYANISGLWKKVAALLPLIGGAASVLIGAGNVLLGLSHASNAAAALNVLKGLNANDPNVIMVLGGLTALGIHTNHQEHTAAIQANALAIQAPLPQQPPIVPPGGQHP